MTKISDTAQTLIETGGFDKVESIGLFLRRIFDDQDQAVFETDSGTFRLSQKQNRNLSKPRQQDHATLEEALKEANMWRQNVKVEDDEKIRKV